MKIGSRSYLTLGFIVTSGLTGLGQSAAAASPETSLTVTIHVCNFAEVDHKTLIEAENVAAGIFRKAGLETRWINPAPSSEHGQEKSTAERTLNLSHIQLNILPRWMAERLGLPNNVMGLAPGTEPDRQRVYVFYEKVKALAESQMRIRGSGGISTYAIRVEILGHAIVHEIGHLLLNLESHSDTGIMRANWDLNQLQAACYGYLVFTPPQAQALRREVARRAGQQETLEVRPTELEVLAKID